MISVITITNRHGGIDINWSALRRQTHKDFEWILSDTRYEERKEAVKVYTKSDGRIVHFKQGSRDPHAKTWLNHAENEAIAKASGELIVLLQDYIHIRPDALEKFWLQYKADPKLFVSGVGHQYLCPPVVDLQGLITVFEKPYEVKPTTVVWQDPRLRKDLGSFYECRPEDWEANWCMAPRQLFLDVGGFDEDYDYQGHAFDNCSVAFRAYALGYKPYLDQSNESFSINNDSFSKEKLKTQEDFMRIATFHQNRMKDIVSGKHPLKYSFLDKYLKNDTVK